MSFHFNLHAVLHYRELRQQQQVLRLEQSLREAERIRQWIAALDGEAAALRFKEARRLADGISAAEMRINVTFLSALRARRKALVEQLRLAETAVEGNRQLFLAARRDIQAVESLRQKQLEVYRRGQLRDEQRRLDALFLLRRSFRKTVNSAG